MYRKLDEDLILNRRLFNPKERPEIPLQTKEFQKPDWEILGLFKPQPRGLKAGEWFRMNMEERTEWVQAKIANGERVVDENDKDYKLDNEPSKQDAGRNWPKTEDEILNEEIMLKSR